MSDDLAAELERCKADLERARRAQSDFLGHISHELRTPLNAIVGLSEMAVEEADPEVILALRSNAHLLLQRVGALLDYSKIEAGLMEIVPRPCDIRSIVAEVIAFNQTQALERGLELILVVREDVPERVRIDPDRVRQIAENLVSNGLRYTHRGTVSVTLKRVASADERPTLELTVEDTGIGIPKQETSLVFTRFYRSYRTSAERNQGTGLGLAMTKALVELMGGAIRLRSEVGVGSVFRVRLPIEEIDAPVVPEVHAQLRRRGRILVADDSDDNLAVVTGILAGTGHQIVTVSDGQEALDATASQGFDLVLMDVDMAPMDGVRATVEIRARESLLGLSRTPIVALTAHVLPEIRRRCHASGMDAFLTKPIDTPLLLETLRQWIDRRPLVLVVDDAPTSRKVLELALSRGGAEVVVASDGKEALAVVDAYRLDAVVLDYELPETTGPELVHQLRARGFVGPVLGVTGHGAAHDEAWAGVDANEVFRKPLDLGRLVATLAGLLCPTVRQIDPDIADLVPDYLNDRRADLLLLRTAVEQQDAETLRKKGHQIRGSGTSYGYPDLTEIGGELEAAAKAADWDALPPLLQRMQGILDE